MEVISHIKRATEPNNSGATLIQCHNQQDKRRVVKKFEHTPSDGRNFNDISLLILKEPFIINNVTRTICLPKSSPPIGEKYSLVQWSAIDGKYM